MNFFFAWRYFNAKKSTNAINIIAWISITAFTFGTAVLILVLSVFNGFEGLVKSLYSSFYTDLKIFPIQGKVLTLTEDQLRKIKSVKGINVVSLLVEEKALLQNGPHQSIVSLKGVDSNYQNVSGVSKNLINGRFELGNESQPMVVLGAGIENALAIQSDRNVLPILVHIPKKIKGMNLQLSENISTGAVFTSGAFSIQSDFDNKYAITNLSFVKQMLGLQKDEFTAVEISVSNIDLTEKLQKNIAELLGENYLVQTKFQQNQDLYSIMQAEKWVIYAVLCLILIIAAFNMIGTLTMLVLEKKKDISVLHALGGSNYFIQKIFLTAGVLLAIIGGIMGMLLALIMAWLQVTFKLIPLQGGSFLIDHFPVQLQLVDFLLVGVTIFVIAILASWIPSKKAANQSFTLRTD